MVMCLIYLGELLGAPTWLPMKISFIYLNLFLSFKGNIDPPVPHSAFIAPMVHRALQVVHGPLIEVSHLRPSLFRGCWGWARENIYEELI